MRLRWLSAPGQRGGFWQRLVKIQWAQCRVGGWRWRKQSQC
jgi:hypothetical protein